MSDEVKQKVQSQFGAAAAAYVTSDVHARGESLGILVDELELERTQQALDVACGAGHTALAMAPHVADVVALDMTPEMLAQTSSLAAARGLTNVRTIAGDAETLPFPDASFDRVTCRIAFHHFPNPRQAMAEMARVLRPGGRLGFTDNFVVADPADADAYNVIEKLRDPSHVWVFPLADLATMVADVGLYLVACHELTKEFEFEGWADRQRASAETKAQLVELFQSASENLAAFLKPRWADGTMYFTLSEVVLIADKPG